MKLAIVGLSGIGSYFVRGLSECLRKGVKGFNRLEPLQIDIIDNDTVEEKNLAYTIYNVEHTGSKKAEVLADLYGYKAVVKRVNTAQELNRYDFIVLCVDNNATRRLVYGAGVPFLDLRAKGKGLALFLVGDYTGEVSKKYLDMTQDTEKKSGSCQYEKDLEDKNIQFGNRTVANIGLQVFKDYLIDGIVEKQLILNI